MLPLRVRKLCPQPSPVFLYDCVARHTCSIIFKFADDTTILGLITDGDETAYRDEVSALSEWCYHNNLSLNISRTKEMIVDYRKLQRGGHAPLYINRAEVESVRSVRFLGAHLTKDLIWSLHTNKAVRSTRQRLFFLRRLRKFGLPPDILTNFYRCTIESILMACITVWYGSCTAFDCLSDLQDIYRSRCLRKINKIRLDLGLGVDFEAISNPKRSNQLIFNNSSPYQYPTTTLLASESKWSSVPVTDPVTSPSIWSVKGHSHFISP
ncbi:hypothetical protein NFI96_001136 [Prochilodus magdalenae]|nr:hypothetical protein NFI96_001136 [Prochilodus magdalenae]